MDAIAVGVGLALLLSAAAAFLAGLLAGKSLPARYSWTAAAIPFAAGCWTTAILLRPWSELFPTRHFHWPLYLTVAAAAIGPLSAAADPNRGFRWRWQLLAASLAALVLVPTYPSLSPPRWAQVPLLAGYLLLLAAALQPLARRVSPAIFTGLLSLSALTVAGLVAAMVSVGYGTKATMAAGALAGCCGALWLAPKKEAAEGLAVGYALVVGGWAYIGARESTPWLWGGMAAALAPLALWIVEAGQQPKNQWWKTAGQCAVVGIALAAAAAWGLFGVE